MGSGNGTSNEAPLRTADRLRRATTDLAAGNQLDKLAFQLGWMCGEFDKIRAELAKKDAVIEELVAEIKNLRSDCQWGIP